MTPADNRQVSRAISARAHPTRRARDMGRIPRINPIFLKFFRQYTRRFIRKHFHAVRLDKNGPPPKPDTRRLIVLMNHPSWWDPLIGLFLAERYFADKSIYAPMDNEQLTRYGILKRLGFFGVDKNSFRGIKSFLSTAERILSSSQNMIWLTPQGRFVDSRMPTTRLERGAAMLVKRHPNARLLPLAVEYAFWNDRLPEVLVRFGSMIPADDLTAGGSDLDEINHRLARLLSDEQRQLAEASMSRDPRRFETCQTGRAGVGGLYDLNRRFRAWWSGETFTAEHGGTNA